jgi:hypothetical protein
VTKTLTSTPNLGTEDTKHAAGMKSARDVFEAVQNAATAVSPGRIRHETETATPCRNQAHNIGNLTHRGRSGISPNVRFGIASIVG